MFPVLLAPSLHFGGTHCGATAPLVKPPQTDRVWTLCAHRAGRQRTPWADFDWKYRFSRVAPKSLREVDHRAGYSATGSNASSFLLIFCIKNAPPLTVDVGVFFTPQVSSVEPQPLTDVELERLSGLLSQFGDERAMNLEQLDGFLVALICGPELVAPSEYLPVIWGDGIVLEDTFTAQPILQDFLSLIMRHWNVIAATLQSGEVFLPLLLQDANGITRANEWAKGFVRGMELRKSAWAVLLNDEDHGGWLVPILALAHENDSNPEMRPYDKLLSPEGREKLIVGLAAGVSGIYRYFQAQRLVQKHLVDNATTFRRSVPKVGRNALCPCGSGKKFKQCCGKPTLH
jgi:uncharacterized protein